MLKRIITVCIVVTFCIGILSGCGGTDLTGKWKRVDGSAFDGMEVSVEKLKDGTYRATLTKINDQAVKAGFHVGDLKWKDVKMVKDNSFDMVDVGIGALYQMNAKVIDNNTITIRDFVKGEEDGSEQKWSRIN